MKKLLLILPLALSLGACQTFGQLVDSVGNIVSPAPNVITKQTLYDFENGMIIAFAGLNAYKKSCIAGAISASCRGTIAKLQGYTRQIPAVLAEVRGFVKNNDQVNALQYFAEAKTLLADFEAVATQNGIKVQ